MGESEHEPVAEAHGGTYDAATGLWDYPDEDGSELTFTALIEAWVLVEGAFQQRLSIDLEAVRHKSFRWFMTRLAYLLIDDNPLAARFRPPPEIPVMEPPPFEL